MNDDSNLSLQQLSPDERDAVAKILIDISHGSTDVYNTVINYDYDEMPVDIDTFLEDDEYLGKVTKNGKTIYPYWRNVLRDIFNNPDKNYHECLVGSTLVPLLDGSTKTIKELVEDAQNGITNYAYSYDLETNRYAPGKIINGAMVSRRRLVYRVTLDNGEFIDCTEDHKFLTRDKHYVMARDLDIGQSLMPFNREVSDLGRETLYHPQKDGSAIKELTYHMVARYKYGDNYVNSPLKIIHHKDFHQWNNNPSNLLRTTNARHLQYHQSHPSETSRKCYWESPKGLQKKQELHDVYIEYNSNDHPNLRKDITKDVLIDALSASENMKSVCSILKCSRSALYHYCNKYEISMESYFTIPPNRYVSSRLDIFNRIYKEYNYISDDLIQRLKSEKSVPHNFPIPSRFISTFFNGDANKFIRVVSQYNHKVISVAPLGYQAVYDIEVDRYHNFAVSPGVIVKNCIFTGAIGLSQSRP